jgi:hypothetical protein
MKTHAMQCDAFDNNVEKNMKYKKHKDTKEYRGPMRIRMTTTFILKMKKKA